MKKFYLMLIFLLVIGSLLLSAPVSFAAVHHPREQHQLNHGAYVSGTAYYSFSSLVTSGANAGTIAASNLQGGLTLYIAADGTFTGTIVGSPKASLPANGSFQSDGSLHLTIFFRPGLTTFLNATLYLQRGGGYTGTFVVTQGPIVTRSGILALIPVNTPPDGVAIRIAALITSGPDQTTPYGGVMILDQSGSFGTIRLQDGRVFPIIAHITQAKITFTFPLDINRLVLATGTSSISNTVTSYTGTFIGPQLSDSGNWNGYLFTFAP